MKNFTKVLYFLTRDKGKCGLVSIHDETFKVSFRNVSTDMLVNCTSKKVYGVCDEQMSLGKGVKSVWVMKSNVNSVLGMLSLRVKSPMIPSTPWE